MAGPNWYVSNDGRVEGPFKASDLATNRLLVPSSYVWHEDLDEWQQVTDSELAGLVAPSGPGPESQPWSPPADAGHAPGTPRTPDWPPQGAPGDPSWGTPPEAQQPPGDHPGWAAADDSSTPSYGAGSPPSGGSSPWSLAAIVCGALAVLFVPIVLGPLGMIFAGIALSKKEPRGALGMGIAIGGMVVGFILSALMYSATR
jgi:hypothetical protein